MKNFIEELTWRGMIHDVMPGAEEHLHWHIFNVLGISLLL